MKCEKIREELMEAVLNGAQSTSLQLQQHLRTCASCAHQLASLQQTMALLDEWQTPEPSPYFGSRLHARLREEEAAPARNWFASLRRPVLAAVAAVVIAIGAGLMEMSRFSSDNNTLANNDGVVRMGAPGSAVGDLQYLDKNADLFSDFDALDGSSSSE